LQINFYIFTSIDESLWVSFAKRDQNPLAGSSERSELVKFEDLCLASENNMSKRVVTSSSRNPFGHFKDDGEQDELPQSLCITDEQKSLYIKRSFESDRPDLLKKILHFFSDEDAWYGLTFAASQNGSVRCLDLLLEYDKKPVGFLLRCYGAFREAIIKGHIHIIEKFLEKGFDLNYREAYEQPLLYFAVDWGRGHIVQKLLDHHPNLGYVDSYGNTLLHRAVEKGYFDIVKTLVSAGVNVNLKNIFKKTALDVAREKYRDTLENKYLSIVYELTKVQQSDECSCVIQ
jgi:hypothetical protein